jgi:hypothetical protein
MCPAWCSDVKRALIWLRRNGSSLRRRTRQRIALNGRLSGRAPGAAGGVHAQRGRHCSRTAARPTPPCASCGLLLRPGRFPRYVHEDVEAERGPASDTAQAHPPLRRVGGDDCCSGAGVVKSPGAPDGAGRPTMSCELLGVGTVRALDPDLYRTALAAVDRVGPHCPPTLLYCKAPPTSSAWGRSVRRLHQASASGRRRLACWWSSPTVDHAFDLVLPQHLAGGAGCFLRC